MDLAQHAAVLWRFRAVVAGGIALGIVLAILASYQVPSFSPRGSETWSSESSLLVTQQGFPEGRVTLPTAPIENPDGTLVQPDTEGRQEFADPDRLSALASLYAQLAFSDRVRQRLPEKPTAAQIQAAPIEGTASTQLPVIKLTTFAATAASARALNTHTVEALGKVLASEQERNNITPRQRVQLSSLNAPTVPVKTEGRSHTASIIAFLLCLLGSLAVAHLLAALRDRQEDEGDVDGVVLPWAVTDTGATAAEPGPEPEPMPMGAVTAHVAEPTPAAGWRSGRRWVR